MIYLKLSLFLLNQKAEVEMYYTINATHLSLIMPFLWYYSFTLLDFFFFLLWIPFLICSYMLCKHIEGMCFKKWNAVFFSFVLVIHLLPFSWTFMRFATLCHVNQNHLRTKFHSFLGCDPDSKEHKYIVKRICMLIHVQIALKSYFFLFFVYRINIFGG